MHDPTSAAGALDRLRGAATPVAGSVLGDAALEHEGRLHGQRADAAEHAATAAAEREATEAWSQERRRAAELEDAAQRARAQADALGEATP